MRKSMPWFRMYAEFVDDPKVQKLNPDLFKFWMNCLGLACQNNGVLPSVSDICWKMKLPEKRVSAALAGLYEAGLLDQEADTFAPHNWSVRQYRSDVSTDRVRRFRNGKETFHETAKKNNETPPETPTDTDTESDTEKHTTANAVDERVRAIAVEIHGRHPPVDGRRDISANAVYKRLCAIFRHKKTPKREWTREAEKININHAAACGSWAAGNNQFVKGLYNWLAPTVERYDVAVDYIPVEQPQRRLLL